MRLSRIVRHVAAGSFILCIVCQFARAIDRPRSAAAERAGDQEQSPEGDAAPMVRSALAAEAEGDVQRRTEYLKRALAADPGYAPAHWHSGEVRAGDRWLSFEAVAAEANRAGKVAKYRQMRERAPGGASGHLSLANWCAAQGLADEERTHLILAMQSGPTKKQAHDIIRRLGLVRYRGTLLPSAQAARAKAEAKLSEQASQDWKPRLISLRRDMEAGDAARRKEAVEQVQAIKDPAAIPQLEVVFAKSAPNIRNAVVATIAAMPGQDATDALIRIAMFSPDGALRQAAAEGLKPRSVYSYVPTLMSALQSPVEVQFEAYFMNGQFRHRLALYQEGPLMDRAVTSIGGSQEHDTLTVHPIFKQPSNLSVAYTPDRTAGADAARAAQEMSANVVRDGVNRRVAAVLRTATGNDFDEDPNPWWNWWFNYNEMYQPPYKPVSTVTLNNMPGTPFTQSVRSISCFPAGTRVETSTGRLAIEQIKPGDCVLAQDADSGELAYKPVMMTTVRPPSPVVEVRIGEETIRATRGHPFWVSGIGWQMAKELKAGQYLHTVKGPVLVDSAEQNGEAECYNLVVADFNSYFVGNAQVLVHDNNLRQVSEATVPGLVEQ